MAGASDALRLLRLSDETGFLLTRAGRIERENDPDHSPGPRLSFKGCEHGNVVRLRHDVTDALAAKLLAVASSEPPWGNAESDPACLPELLALLATNGPVERIEVGVDHLLPHGLAHERALSITCSDSAEGAMLAARFARDGMPGAMNDAGFKTVSDLWLPWCIARDRDDVASIAFAARLGASAAAIGVYTFPGFRGRGYAAAVTAAWSSLAGLKDRVLFYGARRDNLSSRRVIERLKLPALGGSIRII